jgi:ribosomal-protein-alanine N-acetyltransferase
VWLSPWEATPPGISAIPLSWGERQSLGVFTQMLRTLRRQARQGISLPFAVTVDDHLAGQLTIGNIVRGAFNSAYAGYWVDSMAAGQGVMPTALALAVDHCFGSVGLHRIEANVRPENAASRRVVEKLGFRQEGLHERYLAIDGAYRDHIGYAVTVEDVPEGMVQRWRQARTVR